MAVIGDVLSALGDFYQGFVGNGESVVFLGQFRLNLFQQVRHPDDVVHTAEGINIAFRNLDTVAESVGQHIRTEVRIGEGEAVQHTVRQIDFGGIHLHSRAVHDLIEFGGDRNILGFFVFDQIFVQGHRNLIQGGVIGFIHAGGGNVQTDEAGLAVLDIFVLEFVGNGLVGGFFNNIQGLGRGRNVGFFHQHLFGADFDHLNGTRVAEDDGEFGAVFHGYMYDDLVKVSLYNQRVIAGLIKGFHESGIIRNNRLNGIVATDNLGEPDKVSFTANTLLIGRGTPGFGFTIFGGGVFSCFFGRFDFTVFSRGIYSCFFGGFDFAVFGGDVCSIFFGGFGVAVFGRGVFSCFFGGFNFTVFGGGVFSYFFGGFGFAIFGGGVFASFFGGFDFAVFGGGVFSYFFGGFGFAVFGGGVFSYFFGRYSFTIFGDGVFSCFFSGYSFTIFGGGVFARFFGGFDFAVFDGGVFSRFFGRFVFAIFRGSVFARFFGGFADQLFSVFDGFGGQGLFPILGHGLFGGFFRLIDGLDGFFSRFGFFGRIADFGLFIGLSRRIGRFVVGPGGFVLRGFLRGFGSGFRHGVFVFLPILC